MIVWSDYCSGFMVKKVERYLIPAAGAASVLISRGQRCRIVNTQGGQMLATLFDGIARHSPEGLYFKQRVEEVGFKQAVFERDVGKPILGSKR